MAFLNPNDGILYVAINRELGGTNTGAWDFKIPSQSYALLPGPWRSAGLFYVDQSGAGRNAEVTLYPTQQRIDIPAFHAIGRAVAAAQSALDITSGAQPGNPGAGFARLWVDANDHLHLLPDVGPDRLMIDDETTLGGVLAGTLPNPSHAPGTHNFTGNIITTGDIRAARAANQGAYYFGTADSTHYIFYDGSMYNWPGGPVNVSGQLSSSTSMVAPAFMSPNDGGGITMQDSNTRIISLGRTTYFDEYNGGWNWRNTAVGSPNTMRLDGTGALSTLGGYAASGNITSTGYLAAAQLLNGALTNRVYFGGDQQYVNTNVWQAVPGYTVGIGLIIVCCMQNGRCALYFVSGGAQTSSLIFGQPGVTWTTTFGSAGINLAWSGTIVAGGGYAIENKSGSTLNLRTIYIGT